MAGRSRYRLRTPPTPADPLAATPPPSATLASWWCVCYARTTADGAAPTTACRASEQECRSLESAVAAGHKGMVARSLTHRCTELRAEHPGDVHGGREVWQASKKAGSWLSLGGCQLPGEGELSQAASGPNPMGDEVIGGLRHGQPAEEVVKLFGEPSGRGRTAMEEATGDYIQTWTYKDAGLAIDMAASTRPRRSTDNRPRPRRAADKLHPATAAGGAEATARRRGAGSRTRISDAKRAIAATVRRTPRD